MLKRIKDANWRIATKFQLGPQLADSQHIGPVFLFGIQTWSPIDPWVSFLVCPGTTYTVFWSCMLTDPFLANSVQNQYVGSLCCIWRQIFAEQPSISYQIKWCRKEVCHQSLYIFKHRKVKSGWNYVVLFFRPKKEYKGHSIISV